MSGNGGAGGVPETTAHHITQRETHMSLTHVPERARSDKNRLAAPADRVFSPADRVFNPADRAARLVCPQRLYQGQ